MGMKNVPYRLYSPEIAPYDFWLFLKVRENPRDSRFEVRESYRVSPEWFFKISGMHLVMSDDKWKKK